MTFRGKSWYYFMVSQIRWIIGAVGLAAIFRIGWAQGKLQHHTAWICHQLTTVATPHLLL